MGKKLYVGNLPFAVNDQALGTIFAEFGTVESARVVIERSSGRSKGFGFVEMSTDDEAQKAISGLNGREYEGRQLNVAEAREQQPRSNGGGGGGGGGRGPGGGGRRGGGGNRFGGGGGREGNRRPHERW